MTICQALLASKTSQQPLLLETETEASQSQQALAIGYGVITEISHAYYYSYAVQCRGHLLRALPAASCAPSATAASGIEYGGHWVAHHPS